MPVASLNQVSLAFGHLPLLEGVSLQIEPGERVSLVGRNGTGKSTLLQILSGEQRPDSGSVWFQPALRVARLEQDVPLATDRTVVDVVAGSVLGERQVAIENGRIREISETQIAAAEARRIDLAGQYLIPGLIDCHVHVTAYTANLGELPRQSPGYVAHRTAQVLNGMLKRGFTTVRDAGGAGRGRPGRPRL